MNPRNDAALLAQQYDDCDCERPQWWGTCGTDRGCYQQALRNYADAPRRPSWETAQNGEHDMSPRGGSLKPGN